MINNALYQNKQLADTQTKLDIQSGKLVGANGYWGILPTTATMISLRFGIDGNNITPQIVGNLGANEFIGLYFAVKDPVTGLYKLGNPVISNTQVIVLNGSTNYGNENLTGQYFFMKSITTTSVGLILIDSNPMYNMCNGLY
jgi:hypothetical protein